ncbi:two-component system CheB/CheR fusion protein [Archangium gephyra]|uniref:histidine kinase n=1 Tax=Archangium gephyra TaxID=48 RepID=A0AAC8TJ83_9BACT|nr:PAS domain-containing sensor histidine kinase [Archangium gephyra]AKJ07997.1 sensory transduction histidine kinase [Archangium gephyra]REG29740.1 two-component system CheB/CheR fusion protein [Archangium gephyra]
METQLPLEQYRLLVEHAPTMVWRAGLDGLCNYFNATWLRFTGRTQEQEVGNGWVSGVHPDDMKRCMEIYLSHFERRQAFEMEYRLRRHDGVYRYIFDRGVPFTDDAGQFAGFIGSCVDVHERREADRAKATFLALATHELRTPLTSMQMYLEAVRRQLAQGEPVANGALTRLGAQLERVSALVQDLEDTGRLDADMPLVLRKEELDLAALVEPLVAHHREANTFRSRGRQRHSIELSLGPGPWRVLADRQRLEQVVNNLLTNALKYSPQGGTLRVTLARAGDVLELSISDPGIGIPAADIPLLGRRYFRASNVSAENFSGLGLGLSLVKDILEAHQGGLRIQSEQGRGTTVTVFLPEAPTGGRS